MTAKAADLLSLPLNRVAVVLVDFQNDFCSQDAAMEPARHPTSTMNEQPGWPTTSPAKQRHWAHTLSTLSRFWTGMRWPTHAGWRQTSPSASGVGKHLTRFPSRLGSV